MRVKRGRTLILAYHRVVRVERDPHMLCVHPDRFADQIEYLRRHAELIPLRAVQERSSGRRVVITFDDGYSDNAIVAGTLEGLGVPTTFFVTAGMVGTQREFWWDKLESLLLTSALGSDHLEVEIEGHRVWMEVGSHSARWRAHSELHGRLRRLPVGAIEQILHELISQLRPTTIDREAYRALNERELVSLGSTDLLEVGAHTISHPLLSAQSLEDQRYEIENSRMMLEGLIGKQVRAFSYPFGGLDAFDGETVRLVEEAGYTFACTGLSGRISPRGHPLRLPRHFVRDWDMPDFAGWLSRWFKRR